MLEPREPYSLEAEQNLLGAMMQRPELIDVLSDGLAAESFFYQDNVEVYRGIVAIRAAGGAIDYFTVAEQVGQLPGGDRALGYCGELVRNTPSVANAREYARIVRERAVERALLSFGQEVVDITQSQEAVESKVAQVQKLAMQIDGGGDQRDTVAAAEVWAEQIEIWQDRHDRHNRGEPLIGLSTGLCDLDKKLGGLQSDQLIIVAGRPAMGKTCLAMGFALDAAINQGRQVLAVSLEMSNSQLMDRAVASVGKVPLQFLKNGTASQEYGDQMALAGDRIQRSGLVFAKRTSATMAKVRAMARRHKMRHGLDLLLVDYLQLMEGDSKGQGRVQEISDISRGFKLLAGELGIPVVLLSQLSRNCEQRPNKRPLPSDLRESGAIEQDADVILFVYRDEVYHPDTEHKGIAEIIIGKGRDVETGTVKAAFLGQYSRFESLASGLARDHIQSSRSAPASKLASFYPRGGGRGPLEE